MTTKKIIIAPLNWGLGHATRCVPIIHSLLQNNFTPVIASDGKALELLQKEFSELESLELPSYGIKYGKNLKLNLALQALKVRKAVQKEQEVIEEFILKNDEVVGVISDNRFGVRSDKVKSVYITHQLNVLAGFATFLTTKTHQQIISKFDECWIPDNKNSEFSGKLSLIKKSKINVKFIGVLSRFRHKETEKDIDVLIIISGVEPNRTSLERKLTDEFLKSKKKVVLVAGRVEKEQKISEEKNIIKYNFVLSSKLEDLINRAKVVICRSGYSSIMDLAVLQKKAIFIPTKHQTEQEYLAKYLSENRVAPFISEEKFTLKTLKEVKNFKGLSSSTTKLNTNLFRLF